MTVHHEIDDNRTPEHVYVPEYNKLYCDGVEVQPWQLTVAEVQKYIPASYQSEWMRMRDPHAAVKKASETTGGNQRQ